MKTYTKFLIAGVMLAALYVGISGIVRRASAAEIAPPSKMEPLDAARMHAAMLEAQQLQGRLQPLLKLMSDTVDKYHLDTDHGLLADAIDWDTGEIHRPQPQVAAATPPPSTPSSANAAATPPKK